MNVFFNVLFSLTLFIHVDKCSSNSSLLTTVWILTLILQSSDSLICCWPFVVIPVAAVTHTSTGKLRLREVYLPVWVINP